MNWSQNNSSVENDHRRTARLANVIGETDVTVRLVLPRVLGSRVLDWLRGVVWLHPPPPPHP
jgi:hypothetical protein